MNPSTSSLTIPQETLALQPPRSAQPRSILMCRPQFFDVTYRINPWMNPELLTNVELAISQWEELRTAYERLGFTVHFIDPAPGLPDMVYTANGGFILDEIAFGARFAFTQRAAEQELFLKWFSGQGYDCVRPQYVSEGEGDILLVDNKILGGYGFRSDLRSHEQLAQVYDREVLSLRLIDPYFYHLDTALTILDPRSGAPGPQIAYYPGAFDQDSLNVLKTHFPQALTVTHSDAHEFGLNAFSDGKNVVTSPGATDFHHQLRAAGYTVIPVELGELRRGGGSIKCCTLELR